jgi:hypothetical protein
MLMLAFIFVPVIFTAIGFLAGVAYTGRQVPNTLARLDDRELKALGRAVATRRQAHN